MSTQTVEINSNSPRLYVGTYAKYNSGSLKGNWLDLDDYADRDSFLEACAELHKDESDPEFMFQDYENIPEHWYSESSAPPDECWEWINLDDDDKEMLSAYVDCTGDDSATIEDARDHCAGKADSKLDYAYEYVDSTGMLDSLPDNLSCYFDYESFARDLFMDMMYHDESGYVFHA